MKEPNAYTTVVISCPEDNGIERHPLRPEHVPSTGDEIRLDGGDYNVKKVEWDIQSGFGTVTVHLIPK